MTKGLELELTWENSKWAKFKGQGSQGTLVRCIIPEDGKGHS